jgi:hypothetical protein
MSPVPLIELQRRLSLVGAIRAGGERPKSGRAPGKKLEAWRITSPRQPLIEQAASLYGGTISPWEGPNGREFQVYTDVDELPVLVMPSYSLRQTYELWEGVTKRMRLCDGVDEELSGAPCICNQTGDDKCDVYTRLVVALPELDTVLGWRLISKGINAAHELPAMIGLIQHAGGSARSSPLACGWSNGAASSTGRSRASSSRRSTSASGISRSRRAGKSARSRTGRASFPRPRR